MDKAQQRRTLYQNSEDNEFVGKRPKHEEDEGEQNKRSYPPLATTNVPGIAVNKAGVGYSNPIKNLQPVIVSLYILQYIYIYIYILEYIRYFDTKGEDGTNNE